MNFIKKHWIGLLFLIMLLSPVVIYTYERIANYIPDKAFQFTPEIRNYISFYKPGKIWGFENSAGKKDSIKLVRMDSDLYNVTKTFLTFMWHRPMKTISINFKHLTKTAWDEKTYNTDSTGEFISISIRTGPYNKDFQMCFSFINWFLYCDTTSAIGNVRKDTLLINGSIVTNYINIADTSTLMHNEGTDIVNVYWVNKYGIIAYKYRNGDLWKRINLSN